jgi:phospholipase/carboxylesterase
MRIESFGPLRARVVGGDDRRGGGDGPVVVLFHGFGAPGDDLVSLHRVLDAPPGTRFVFPEAPLELEGHFGGRAWWMIDMARLERAMERGEIRDLSNEVPDGLASARDAATAMLRSIETNMKPSKIALGGFSQGAMLALDTTLRDARTPDALVLLSGTLIAEDEWAPRFSKLANVPVFMSHGRSDALLGFAIAERLRARLADAGASVAWNPFAGGHEIPGGVIDALGAFLRRTLA